MKSIATAVAGLLVLLILIWVFAFNGLAMYGFFAPKEEAIRRQTFEESKAYNDGMVKDLRSMQTAYLAADAAHQAALKDVIKQRVAGYPYRNLPPDLQDFLSSLDR